MCNQNTDVSNTHCRESEPKWSKQHLVGIVWYDSMHSANEGHSEAVECNTAEHCRQNKTKQNEDDDNNNKSIIDPLHSQSWSLRIFYC